MKTKNIIRIKSSWKCHGYSNIITHCPISLNPIPNHRSKEAVGLEKRHLGYIGTYDVAFNLTMQDILPVRVIHLLDEYNR